jgi:hypothetical protein
MQGVEHLLVILLLATGPTPTGHLLRTIMEEMQLETGSSQSFFSFSYRERLRKHIDMILDCRHMEVSLRVCRHRCQPFPEFRAGM